MSDHRVEPNGVSVYGNMVGAAARDEIAALKQDNERLRNVLACLLDHYDGCYDDGDGKTDAVSALARGLVPDWQERANEFDPTA